MKQLKLLVLSTFIVVAISVPAQTDVMPAFDVNLMAQKKTAEIKANVSHISTEEETLLSTIEQDYAQSVQAAFSKNNIDNDAIHKEIEELRDDRDKKIKSVLDNDQYIQYMRLEEQNEAKWKGNNSTGAYEY